MEPENELLMKTRWFSFLNRWFSGSMLMFQGVSGQIIATYSCPNWLFRREKRGIPTQNHLFRFRNYAQNNLSGLGILCPESFYIFIYIYIYIYIHIFALADPNPGPRNSRRLEPPSISTQPSSFQSRRYAVYISNTSRRLRCLGGDLNDLDPWRGEQDGFPWVSPSAIGSNVSLRYFPKPGPNSK